MSNPTCPSCSRASEYLKETYSVRNEAIDPLTAGVLTALVVFIYNFLFLFLYSWSLAKTTEVDKKLTAKLNEITKTPGKWIVRIINSRQLNAFTFGGNNMYVFREMLKVMTEKELLAVCLHEAAHANKGHVTQLITSNSLLVGVISGVGKAILLVNPPLSLAFTLMAILINSLVVQTWFSRVLENQADDYVVEMGYGEHLASALKKMGEKYKVDFKECKTQYCKLSRRMDEIFSTHPDIRRRIQEILERCKSFEDVKKSMAKLLKMTVSALKSKGETIPEV